MGWDGLVWIARFRIGTGGGLFFEHGSKTTGSVNCGNLSSCGTVGILRSTVPSRFSYNAEG